MHPAIGHLPIAGEVTYRYDQRLARIFRRPVLDAGDRRHVQRAHGVGRQLAHSVPRDEHRFAGKRSRAGRDDDGVRRADQPDYRRRHRRVLGRDDRGAQPAARRRAFRRRRHARVRRQLGRRGSGPRHSELVCRRHRRPHAERRRRDRRQRPLLARISAARQRRRDQRTHPRREVDAPPTSSTRSTSTTTTSKGMVSGEYHLYGPYQGPFGFGTLTIDNGIAYGEPFETASGSLRFEGNGVRIDGIQMQKSGGTAEGAAFVGWNGTYSFNATGRRIPLEGVKAMAYPQAPLTGLLEFNADGTGTFDVPRYQFRGRIRDLFVARRRRRRSDGAPRRARRQHDDRDRGRVAAPRRVGHRPHRPHRDAERRRHAALYRHVARSLRARVREAPLAVHDGGRQRHAARHRRAREPRAARRRRDVRPAANPDVRLSAAQREADSRADEQQRRPDRRHAVRRRRHRARRDRARWI